MADDGKAEVIVQEIPKEAEDAAGEAEERCPVDVITIY
jgi:ferredoxin